MISKDELIEALKGLTPDQLNGILAQGYGRSPIRTERQLHDLRLQPTATDPRPLFVPSVDAPRDVIITHSPFPRLLWHRGTGEEITVHSLDEVRLRGADWTDVPPNQAPLDPLEHARQLFEALSPEDQAFVLEHQRKARLDRVNAYLGTLSEHQVAQAMTGEPKKAKKKD